MMRNLFNLSFKAKITSGAVAMLIMIAFTLVFLFTTLGRKEEIIGEIKTTSTLSNDLADVDASIARIKTLLFEAAYVDNEKASVLNEAEKELQMLKNNQNEIFEGFDESENVKEVFDKLVKLEVIYQNQIDLMRSGEFDEAKQLFMGEGSDFYEQVYSATADLERKAQKQKDQLYADYETEGRKNVVMMAIISILLVLVVLLVLFLTTRLVSKLSKELKSSVQVLSTSVAEIQTTVTEISTGATETATAVSETTSTVEEVKQTASVASERAGSLQETSERASEMGDKGLETSQSMVDAMRKISEQMKVIINSINKLEEQNRSIAEITTTVADIADQSNMLAVNASIEASKAGEHGKGFSVVAQEIKSLAEQSKKSASQIRDILGEVQKLVGTICRDN
ncbi:MAG: methyl-accepting chemotaxis protein [Bacteroidales bacterium]|nr:methyl-accepting chemotaxis protein [Bacteroidales bacterium]